MGNGASANNRIKLAGKPIVIVIGGGVGGCQVASHLDNHFNVILLERKSFRFLNYAALRAVVTSEKIDDSEWLPRIFIPYTVIATGSSYAFPAKVLGVNAEEVKQSFVDCNKAISAAKKITIVGGGAVGVELAAEIASHFNADSGKSGGGELKSITIVHPFQWLGGSEMSERFHQELKTRLTSTYKNINLVLGEKVVLDEEMEKKYTEATGRYLYDGVERIIKTNTGKEIPTDLLFWCGGAKVNSEPYETSPIFANSIEANTKRLKVNEYLQVENVSESLKGRIYAVGDCANAKEMKLGALADPQGQYVAKAIISIDAAVKKNAIVSGLSPYKLNRPLMAVVLGSNEGVFQLPNGMVFGRKLTIAIKGDFFYKRVWGTMNLNPPSPTTRKSSLTDYNSANNDNNWEIEHVKIVLNTNDEDAKKLLQGAC